MKNKLEANSGAALTTGSILMIITMVMHPSGGNVEHLFKVITMVMVAHSIAILSVPLVIFWFLGLNKKIR